MTQHRVGALLVAAAFGLGGLAACGGDDDPSTEETTTTAPSGEGSTDDPTLDFGGECEEFSQAFVDASQAVGNALSGGSDDIEEVASYFEEVTENLPEEIQDDFGVFAEAYTEFARAMADSDIDPQAADPEALAELQEIMSEFSSAEVQEASSNIQAYITENCSS